MLVRKITIGFVIQEFDTEKGAFVSQEFIAGEDVSYENERSCVIDSEAFNKADGEEDYLPFEMVQPVI